MWEAACPRRERLHPRRVRWAANLGMVILNSVVLRLVFPMAAVAFAMLAAKRGWGLITTFARSDWAGILIAVMALDFATYLQHVMFRAVPALWRLHRVHHANPDYDLGQAVYGRPGIRARINNFGR